MVDVAYADMNKTLNDPELEAIQQFNSIAADSLWQTSSPMALIGIIAAKEAAIRWAEKVKEDGKWDTKSVLSQTIWNCTHDSSDDDYWFVLPGGKPNRLTNFNVFGNIWYGYVGSAAGFARGTLLTAGWGFDLVSYKEWLTSDVYANEKGITLWEQHDYFLDRNDLHQVILDLDNEDHSRYKAFILYKVELKRCIIMLVRLEGPTTFLPKVRSCMYAQYSNSYYE